MAFCCFSCTCSEVQKERSGNVKMTCGNSGNKHIHHSFCCHNIPKSKESSDWLSPVQVAIDKGLALDGNPYPAGYERFSFRDLTRLKMKAGQMEKSFHEVLCAEQIHSSVEDRTFDLIKSSQRKMKPLVILNIFPGIGDFLVALKRNSIAIKAAILVETNTFPVETHVSRHHHDSSYNTDLSGGGVNCILPTVELKEMATHLLDNLFDHGPINFVFASPPLMNECKDKLLQIAKVIKNIERHPLQKGEKVLYMTLAPNDIKIANREVNKAYGADPIQIDSKLFSSCSKKSLMWTNIPLNTNEIEPVDGSPVLDDDFQLLETVCESAYSSSSHKLKSFQPFPNVDDKRMIKVKRTGNAKKPYLTTFLSVADRERSLGLKEGYVQSAVKDLFQDLREAFLVESDATNEHHWCDKLHKKYYHFMRCNYDFKPSSDFPFFEIKMEPPSSKKNKKFFFDAETYAKHLIGNTSSIPMIQHLLSPLKEICSLRDYDGYNY